MRFNFIFLYKKAENKLQRNKKEFFRKETYWLYNHNIGKFFIINPEEKIYFELPETTIFSNLYFSDNTRDFKKLKVEIKNLGKDIIDGFKCEHLHIKYS